VRSMLWSLLLADTTFYFICQVSMLLRMRDHEGFFSLNEDCRDHQVKDIVFSKSSKQQKYM
jgi:hypothetical protein